jgi:hypothetical protein
MSRQDIELLLAEADTALASGMLKEAERLYDQAADLAVTDDELLFSRALAGIEKARSVMLETPFEAKIQSQKEKTDESKVNNVDVSNDMSSNQASEDSIWLHHSDHGSSNDIKSRITQLEFEAELYLQEKSNTNYKRAISCLERIMAFTDIDSNQSQYYRKKIEDIKREREEFLAKYGELITARQLDNTSQELVLLVKLYNNGTTKDIGSDRDIFDMIIGTVENLRQRMMNSAKDQDYAINIMIKESIYYLNTQMAIAAKSKIDIMLDMLYDRGIRENEYNWRDEESLNAVNKIKKWMENEEIKDFIHYSLNKKIDIEIIISSLNIVSPMLESAYKLFEENRFEETLETLQRIKSILGENISQRVESMIYMTETRLRKKLNNILDQLIQDIFIMLSSHDDNIYILEDKIQQLHGILMKVLLSIGVIDLIS